MFYKNVAQKSKKMVDLKRTDRIKWYENSPCNPEKLLNVERGDTFRQLHKDCRN